MAGNDRTLLRSAKNEIRQEYLADNLRPWIIGYSGGKDSTLVTQLVVETVLSVPPDRRNRRVYILYNDTQVESPVFQDFVLRSLQRIEHALSALHLPIQVVVTKPANGESFWVNLLGKGYPAPNRSFRWCMDRLKIEPTHKFIKDLVVESGECILILGVRKGESSARDQRLEKHKLCEDNSRLSPNADIPGCYVFRPILRFSTEQVWQYLEKHPPPWGHSKENTLFDLYKDAGMCNATQACPLMDESVLVDSKSVMARFGCWTCTVIKQDRSLQAMIDNGYAQLRPLLVFRERLQSVSDDPHFRSKIRRNGSHGLGPLTFEAREMLLDELVAMQTEMNIELISPHEIRLIRDQWQKDKIQITIRQARVEVERLTKTHGEKLV